MTDSSYLIRLIGTVLAAVLVAMVLAMLVGLFLPETDHATISQTLSHAFDTIVGVFVGVLTSTLFEEFPMPWTPEEFRVRHAKDLSPSQAKKAAAQANAMLKSGTDEGVAIATAIKHAKRSGGETLYPKK